MGDTWDCVIVGGGAAGLSAALVLGRALRQTLVIDSQQQSNSTAHGIGGLLGNDGTSPAEFYATGRAELSKYPSVQIRTGDVTLAEQGFAFTLSDGTVERTRTLVLAMGMDYEVPGLPGIQELWGGSVFHCPFCHGWEVHDRPLAVLGSDERAFHSALLLRNWSDDVIVLSDGPCALSDPHRELLAKAGIGIDERRVAGLISANHELTAVEFTDGTTSLRSGLLVAATMRQRSPLAYQLGIATATTPMAVDAIVVDELQCTSVPGVFAAGDVTGRMPQVAAAVAAGSLAATSVMRTLLAEDVGLPSPNGA